MVLGIVMLAAFAWKPGGLSLLEVCGLLTIGGAGLGVMYPVTTTIVQNSVAPHQLGTATGALNFARQLGGAIIVAAFATIVLGGIDSGGHGLTLDMLRGGAQAGRRRFRAVVPLAVRGRRGLPRRRPRRRAVDRGAAAARARVRNRRPDPLMADPH